MSDETITQAECERMRELADAVRRYHTERVGYGGASREFHAYAETLLKVDVPRLIDALAAAEKRAEEAGRLLGEQANHVLAQCGAIAHLEAERDELEQCLLEIDLLVDPEHEHETWIAPVRALLARAEKAEREADRMRHGVAIEGDIVCSARRELDRLQPLIDAARTYATTVGNRKARSDLLNAAFDLFAEEARRG